MDHGRINKRLWDVVSKYLKLIKERRRYALPQARIQGGAMGAQHPLSSKQLNSKYIENCNFYFLVSERSDTMQFSASVFFYLFYIYIFLCMSSLFGAVKLLRFSTGQRLKLVLKIVF